MPIKNCIKAIIIINVFFTLSLTGDETHKIKITAGIIPVYAENKKGEPISDLCAEEFRLWINGKERKFVFNNFSIHSGADKALDKEVVTEPPSTTVIILDTIFNSIEGLKNSREFMKKIIRQKTDSENFMIIDLNLSNGIRFISRGSDDSVSLINNIENLKLSPSIKKSLMGIRKRNNTMSHFNRKYGFKDASFEPQAVVEPPDNFYRFSVSVYRKLFSNLRYLLKQISSRKTCILISEGIKLDFFLKRSYRKVSADYNQYQNTIVRLAALIQASGSVLYTFNPSANNISMRSANQGEHCLKALARLTGGKYSSRLQENKFIKSISDQKRSYYELAYTLRGNEKLKRKNSVKIRCRRSGIRIRNTETIMRVPTYSEMSRNEKRHFVSELIRNREFESYRKIRVPFSRKLKTNGELALKLKLPARMKNIKSDIYQISFNILKRTILITEKRGTPGDPVITKPGKISQVRRFILMVPANSKICPYIEF